MDQSNKHSEIEQTSKNDKMEVEEEEKLEEVPQIPKPTIMKRRVTETSVTELTVKKYEDLVMYDRQELLDQMGEFVTPVVVTCGTYSSTLCVFLFPLLRKKNITNQEERESLFPILGMSKYHTRSIDHMFTLGKYLFTGGDDETINHFDMLENCHCGKMRTFEGGVSALESFGQNYEVICGTENGSVLLYRYFSKIGYQLVWKKWCHKNSEVRTLSVHPSNRLAVSVCSKRKLCLLNLLSGKIQYEMKLDQRCNILKWWKYNSLIVIEERRIRCFRLNQRESEFDSSIIQNVMSPLFSYQHRFEVTSLEVMNEFSFMTGDTEGRFQIWNYDGFNLDLTHEVEGIHSGRIKGISCQEVNIMEYLIFVISDSDGSLSIWRLKQNEEILKMQYFANFNVRFMSIGVNFLKPIAKMVKKDYFDFRRKKLKDRFVLKSDDEGKGEESESEEEEGKKEKKGGESEEMKDEEEEEKEETGFGEDENLMKDEEEEVEGEKDEKTEKMDLTGE